MIGADEAVEDETIAKEISEGILWATTCFITPIKVEVFSGRWTLRYSLNNFWNSIFFRNRFSLTPHTITAVSLVVTNKRANYTFNFRITTGFIDVLKLTLKLFARHWCWTFSIWLIIKTCKLKFLLIILPKPLKRFDVSKCLN